MERKPDEGLEKNPSGSSEPLLLDVKRGKGGIVTDANCQGNLTKRLTKKVASKNSSPAGEHCVSSLYVYCAKKKWCIPKFEVLDESGPSHRKTYIMTVNVNGQQYTSSRCQNKKIAKLEAAKACLKAIGKNPSGSSEPLLLDVKRGKGGIVTDANCLGNLTKRLTKKVASQNSSPAGEHCVSSLYVYCAKKKWCIPKFEVLDEFGPSHRKTYIMTVNVNGQQYTSSRCQNKKIAKLEAAKACLKAIGVLK